MTVTHNAERRKYIKWLRDNPSERGPDGGFLVPNVVSCYACEGKGGRGWWPFWWRCRECGGTGLFRFADELFRLARAARYDDARRH